MPILFLSAKTRDVDKAEGLANGGDDYLDKAVLGAGAYVPRQGAAAAQYGVPAANGGSTAPDRAKRRVRP